MHGERQECSGEGRFFRRCVAFDGGFAATPRKQLVATTQALRFS
jgi:hypothetical protein